MNNISKKILDLVPNFNKFKKLNYQKSLCFTILTLSSFLIIPIQQIRSEQIFLKCIGKYEINRGALIKPDWETSYLIINLNGIKSTIDANGIKKQGRTSIRRNSFTITHRDDKNKVKNIYRINGLYGTYTVESPQINRTLLGTCQKGRG